MSVITGGNAENNINQAVRQIFGDYGDKVSVGAKNKSLTKFGVNPDITTVEEMVWSYGGVETLPTSGNPIDTISSSNTNDTQEVVIEGHTLAGSELTFVAQTATLNGQNKVTLSTPLYRSTRVYNNGSVPLEGDVYVYEDDTISNGVPQTDAKVHLKADVGNDQSLKAATSVSNSDYWLVTGVTLGVNRQSSRAVEFKIQVKEFGKVFRTRIFASCSSDTGSVYLPQDPLLIVPKNADVRVLATSTGTGTGVEATLHGRPRS